MILIADSGSTKTAWIYTDGTTHETYITGGANPFFRSTADMIAEWRESRLSLLNVIRYHRYTFMPQGL
jgi:hypothetical protein